MNIAEISNILVASLLNIMFCIIIIKTIFKENVIEKKSKVMFIMIILTVTVTIINLFNKTNFKVLITMPIMAVGMKYIFNSELLKAYLTSIVATIYMFFGEILAMIMIKIFNIDYTFILNNLFGKILGLFPVILCTMPFLFIKPIKTFFSKTVGKLYSKKFLLMSTMFLLFIGSILYKNGKGSSDVYELTSNLIIFISFAVITLLLNNEFMQRHEFSQNYNVLLSYLEKYEKDLNEKNKLIHDYNNQLIVINGYIEEKNEKLKNYVKTLIQEQKSISSNLLLKNLEKLPKGLKGLLYYKLSNVETKLNVSLIVSDNIKKSEELENIIDKDMLKVAGILLDNAIEASLESSDKIMSLSLTKSENSIEFNIENTFNENIDIDKIYLDGYSTKGKNRGYGLAIIKDIINKKSKYKIQNNISNGIFTSKFIIKTI